MKIKPSIGLLAPVATAFLCAACVSSAATRTWQDTGIDEGSWVDPDNWVAGLSPTTGDDIVFPGIGAGYGVSTKDNDIPNGTLSSISGITYNNNANLPGITLTGNGLQLTGDIVNDNANLQTINIALELNAAGIELNAANGGLTIGAALSGGSGFEKTGSGTLTLNTANSYSGGTVLSQGAIQLGSVDGALGSGDFEFAGGVLNANNREESLGALSLTATSTLNLLDDGDDLNDLTFASAIRDDGTLTITGWTGAGGFGGGGGTGDRIFVSSAIGDADFLQNIIFDGFNGNAPGALQLGTGEIVPVPEPIEWALIMFASVAVLVRFVLPRIRRSAC